MPVNWKITECYIFQLLNFPYILVTFSLNGRCNFISWTLSAWMLGMHFSHDYNVYLVMFISGNRKKSKSPLKFIITRVYQFPHFIVHARHGVFEVYFIGSYNESSDR